MVLQWIIILLNYSITFCLLISYYFLLIIMTEKKLQKSYKLFLKNVWVIFLKIALRKSTSCTKRHHLLCRLCIILFWLLWKGRRWKNQSQSFLVFFECYQLYFIVQYFGGLLGLLQLLLQPGIKPGPHWSGANTLTTTL